MMREAFWIGVFAAITLVAGCVDPGRVQEQNKVLHYEGSENGNHEETAECDGDGRISGSGNVQDGQVRLTVRDGEGEPIFDKTYEGEFDAESSEATGKEGRWTIHAQRSGDDVVGDEFSGRYTFTLNC